MENNETIRSLLPSPETVAIETTAGVAEFGKTAVKVVVEAMTEPFQIVDSTHQTHPSVDQQELARIRAELLAQTHEEEPHVQQPPAETPTPPPAPEGVVIAA